MIMILILITKVAIIIGDNHRHKGVGGQRIIKLISQIMSVLESRFGSIKIKNKKKTGQSNKINIPALPLAVVSTHQVWPEILPPFPLLPLCWSGSALRRP